MLLLKLCCAELVKSSNHNEHLDCCTVILGSGFEQYFTCNWKIKGLGKLAHVLNLELLAENRFEG